MFYIYRVLFLILICFSLGGCSFFKSSYDKSQVFLDKYFKREIPENKFITYKTNLKGNYDILEERRRKKYLKHYYDYATDNQFGYRKGAIWIEPQDGSY